MKELRDSWIDILMILSDDKGHPLWELAKKTKREEGNLRRTLKLLETELPEGPWNYGFKWYDFKDLAEFSINLRKAKDPLSRLIFENTNLSVERKNLNHYDVLFAINDLLDDSNLINNFPNVKLNSKLKPVADKNHGWADLRSFNRLLLEEAYTNDIYKAQNSIIYSGMSRKTTNPKSGHPNAREIPYYISKDLYVFNFIFINMEKLLNNLIQQNNPDFKEYREIPDGAEDFFTRKVVDVEEIDWDSEIPIQIREEFDRNIERFFRFYASNYTYSMIEKFGFKKISGILGERIFHSTQFFLAKRLLDENLLKKPEDIEIAKKIIANLSYLENDNES